MLKKFLESMNMTKAKKNAKTKSAAKPVAKKAPAKAPAKKAAAVPKKVEVKKVAKKNEKVEKKMATPVVAKKKEVKGDVKKDLKKEPKKNLKQIQTSDKKIEVKKEKAATLPAGKKATAISVAPAGKKVDAKNAKEAGKQNKTVAVVVETKIEVSIDTEVKVKPEVKENIGIILDPSDVNRVFSAMNPEDLLNLDSDECQAKSCDNPSTTGIYCRFHYIKSWNEIKKQISIIKDKKLQAFIEDLFCKYGTKQLEQLNHDLSDEKSFLAVLKDLNIEADEEAFDEPDEDVVDDDTDIAFETKNTKVSYMED